MQAQAKRTTAHCPECDGRSKRFGKHRNGLQRYRCNDCLKTFTEEHERPLGPMTIKVETATLALQLLIEGTSVRSAERITGLHRDTILKLMVLAGERCERMLGRRIVNVPVRDVQCDEIWSFVGKKQKALKPGDDPNFGDAYTFVAIERHTKLVLNFALGKRNEATTDLFIDGLRSATASDHFQVSTDGFSPYRLSIGTKLHDRVDFAQIIKVYRASPEGERRYSPAEIVDTEVVPIIGTPDIERVCTSHVERQNLTMRMQIRRLTRLTNAFSKKWENLWAALCLHFAYYNFCRVHSTIRVTPAMESGLTDHVWTIGELLATQD